LLLLSLSYISGGEDFKDGKFEHARDWGFPFLLASNFPRRKVVALTPEVAAGGRHWYPNLLRNVTQMDTGEAKISASRLCAFSKIRHFI